MCARTRNTSARAFVFRLMALLCSTFGVCVVFDCVYTFNLMPVQSVQVFLLYSIQILRYAFDTWCHWMCWLKFLPRHIRTTESESKVYCYFAWKIKAKFSTIKCELNLDYKHFRCWLFCTRALCRLFYRFLFLDFWYRMNRLIIRACKYSLHNQNVNGC